MFRYVRSSIPLALGAITVDIIYYYFTGSVEGSFKMVFWIIVAYTIGASDYD